MDNNLTYFVNVTKAQLYPREGGSDIEGYKSSSEKHLHDDGQSHGGVEGLNTEEGAYSQLNASKQ